MLRILSLLFTAAVLTLGTSCGPVIDQGASKTPVVPTPRPVPTRGPDPKFSEAASVAGKATYRVELRPVGEGVTATNPPELAYSRLGANERYEFSAGGQRVAAYRSDATWQQCAVGGACTAVPRERALEKSLAGQLLSQIGAQPDSFDGVYIGTRNVLKEDTTCFELHATAQSPAGTPQVAVVCFNKIGAPVAVDATAPQQDLRLKPQEIKLEATLATLTVKAADVTPPAP